MDSNDAAILKNCTIAISPQPFDRIQFAHLAVASPLLCFSYHTVYTIHRQHNSFGLHLCSLLIISTCNRTT